MGLAVVVLSSWQVFAASRQAVPSDGETSILYAVFMLSTVALAFLFHRRQLEQLARQRRDLFRSENRLRMIIEGVSVVAWEYDAGSDAFTYVTPSVEALLGFSPDAWLRSGFWHACLHPEDRPRVLAWMRYLVLPAKQYECEYRMLRADGSVIHVRDLRSVVETHPGHVAGMRGVLLDISARKASESALADSEARFRSAFEQASVGMALCSVAGRYLRINERYGEITGHSAAHLLLRDYRELTHPADLEQHERLLDALVLGAAGMAPIEKRMLRADGSVVWVRLTMSMVDSRDSSVQFMEVIEDITARRLAERELRESEGRLRTILCTMHEGVIMRDASGEIITANESARRIYGLHDDEHFSGQAFPAGLHFVHEDGTPCAVQDLPTCVTMRTGEPAVQVVGIDRRDGSRCWVLASAAPLELDQQLGQYPVVSTLFDITESRESENALRLAASVFDSSVEAIMITDARRRILQVNRAFRSLTGYSSDEVIGQTPAILCPSNQGLGRYESIWRQAAIDGVWQGELWQRRRDGSEFPEWLSIGVVRDRAGRVSNHVAIFSDITERKASEARIAFLAHHDPLTALPNRTLFRDRIEQALARAEHKGSLVALLFLDLDRFKTINDSLGHVAGDRLLQAVAERLQHCVREEDTICRQGGDEFILLLPELADAELPARIAEKILRRLSQPFEIDGHVLGTSVSIGIAVHPWDGKCADLLMKNADTAMYHAKARGRNTYRFFTEAMNTDALERLKLENCLRGALDRGEFRLHFQPQVDLLSGEVVGAEALLRWSPPELGAVSPARFVPIAEESGRIIEMGRWVLREACLEAARWPVSGPTGVGVSVNLSALQFRRDDIVRNVSLALAESGLPPNRLELELTESLLMEQAEEVLETVRRLKLLGVRLAIDDFGTGYSSLSYLKRFAVDRLKIDQSFVRDIVEDPDDAAIVRAVIQLGRSLKLEVIAEGAESAAQVDFLVREGCGEAQGHYFWPPLPGSELAGVLAGTGPQRGTAVLAG